MRGRGEGERGLKGHLPKNPVWAAGKTSYSSPLLRLALTKKETLFRDSLSYSAGDIEKDRIPNSSASVLMKSMLCLSSSVPADLGLPPALLFHPRPRPPLLLRCGAALLLGRDGVRRRGRRGLKQDLVDSSGRPGGRNGGAGL